MRSSRSPPPLDALTRAPVRARAAAWVLWPPLRLTRGGRASNAPRGGAGVRLSAGAPPGVRRVAWSSGPWAGRRLLALEPPAHARKPRAASCAGPAPCAVGGAGRGACAVGSGLLLPLVRAPQSRAGVSSCASLSDAPPAFKVLSWALSPVCACVRDARHPVEGLHWSTIPSCQRHGDPTHG